MLARTLFWGSFGLVLYTYLGFPLLLLIHGLLRRRPVRTADISPHLSFIIVAHNEAEAIAAKLDNVLALDYPPGHCEVIVASDGSDDGTDEIVAGYANHGVKLLAFPRRGKIPALNAAVTLATGEILVFSDADSILTRDALRALVRPFADPTVGAVSGNQLYLSADGGSRGSLGERLYWSFDRTLKTLESEAGNIIAAIGALHAIRRELFRPVPLGVGDDFVISTRTISQGFRLVFAPGAIVYGQLAPTDRAQFQRKVRVIVRGLRGLVAVRELFEPTRYGFYAIQIFSHKLLRWSVGWLLIVLFCAALSLSRAGSFYLFVVLSQVAFYTCALGSLALARTGLGQRRAVKVLSVPFYFCLANLAAVCAWLQLLRGRRIDVWDSHRPVAEAQPAAGPQQ